MPSDGTISKLTIPVLEDGTVTNKTYDLPAGGGDVSGKADKVIGAVTGNFAGLDANGNLTDSGNKPSDIPTKVSDLTNDAGYVTTDHTYNFTGDAFYSTNGANTASITLDCNSLTANGHYYYTTNGPSTTIGATTSDGAVYVQGYNDLWVTQIAQDYRTGNLFIRSKSSGTWTPWRPISADMVSEYVIAPVETGTTASQAYTVGVQFLKDGKLYKAKTAIASGDTFTLNTNYEAADDITTQLANSGSDKMDKANPTGTGSFSLNRKANTTIGDYSVAEGFNTTASGTCSHAEGQSTTSSGSYSHAEGYYATSSGNSSHAEGYYATASSSYSHAEGRYTEAKTSAGAHAEGYGYNSTYKVIASGQGAHAEGVASSSKSVTASGNGSHAEGYTTTASGSYSHAEGSNTTASGSYSHAGGRETTASGSDSFATGYGTIAAYSEQMVTGTCNSNKSTTLFEVGNGSNNVNRSNAFEVYSDGSLSTNNGTTKTKLPVIVSSTLAANATQVILSGVPSTGTNLVRFYTSVPGLNYTAISVSGTDVTLTYPAQTTDTTVYAEIIEVTS